MSNVRRAHTARLLKTSDRFPFNNREHVCKDFSMLNLCDTVSGFGFSIPAQASPPKKPDETKQVRIELAEAFSQGDLKGIFVRVEIAIRAFGLEERKARPELASARYEMLR